MYTYSIYKINKNMGQFFNQYPNTKIKLLSLEAKNSFYSHQMEALYDTTEGINEYLYQKLSHRSDYRREANIHTIYNVLTKEHTICKVSDYKIEITASKKSNIFYDILYQYSKRYVIMNEQCNKQEV